MPRVSIGLPVYNGARFVETALRGILEQTYGDFEVLISDNGSTDGTERICRAFAESDRRVRYVRQPTNIGAGGNFNYVFHHTSGEFFKWAAHDDFTKPDFLETCVALLDENPSAVLAMTGVEIRDADGELVEPYVHTRRTASTSAITRVRDQIKGHECFEIFGLIRREALDRTPVMGNYFGGDAALLLRLVLQGPFVECDAPLFVSRRHASQSAKFRRRVRQWSEWFDPTYRGKITLPYWRLLGEYIKMLGEFRMPLSQRLGCGVFVLKWAIHRRRHLVRDVFNTVIVDLPRAIHRALGPAGN